MEHATHSKRLLILTGAAFASLAAKDVAQASSLFANNEITDNSTSSLASDAIRGLGARISTTDSFKNNIVGAEAFELPKNLGAGVFARNTSTNSSAGAIAFEASRGLSSGVFVTESIDRPIFSNSPSKSLFGGSGLPSIETARAAAFETPEGLRTGIFVGESTKPVAFATIPVGTSTRAPVTSLNGIRQVLSGTDTASNPIFRTEVVSNSNSSPPRQSGTLNLQGTIKAVNSLGKTVLETTLKALTASAFSGDGNNNINTAATGFAESRTKIFNSAAKLIAESTVQALGSGTFSNDGTNIVTSGAGATESTIKGFNSSGRLTLDTKLKALGSGTFSNDGTDIATAGAGAVDTSVKRFDSSGDLTLDTKLKALGSGTFSNDGIDIATAGAGAADTSISAKVNGDDSTPLDFSLLDQSLTWQTDLAILGTGIFSEKTANVKTKNTSTLTEFLQANILPNLLPDGLSLASFSPSSINFTEKLNAAFQAINLSNSFTESFALIPTNGVNAGNFSKALQTGIPASLDQATLTSYLDLLPEGLVPSLSGSGDINIDAIEANLKAQGAGTFGNTGAILNASGAGIADGDFSVRNSGGEVIFSNQLNSKGSGTFKNDSTAVPEPSMIVASASSLLILGGVKARRKRKQMATGAKSVQLNEQAVNPV